MSGTLEITIQEARGYVAVPAELDALAVVMGVSSLGSGQSPFYLSASSVTTGLGRGDGTDDLCQIIEQVQSGGAVGNKFPAAMYSVPGTTPATYGAIDVTGVLGTALVSFDATSLPLGSYDDAAIKIINGGTVGATGITLQWRLGKGSAWSRTYALGTADSFTIPNSAVKFLLNPSSTDLTALNTLINASFVAHNAHVIYVTGTVHTNADTVDVVSAGTYPSATNAATRKARINAVIAAAKLHAVKGTGGAPATHINVGGDATYLAALTAIPLAVDDETSLAAAVAFAVAHNAHILGASAWHTVGDSVNVIAAPAPSAGTLLAGDIAKGRTFGAAPIAADIDAAFAALVAGPVDFSILVLSFPLTAALALRVTIGLNALNAVGRRPLVLAKYRLPNFESAETEATWGAAYNAEFALGTIDDSRIHVRTAYGMLTDARTGNVYLRSDLGQFAADVVRVPRAEWPDTPHDQKMANFSLVDANGVLVGHDEGPGGAFTGMSNDTLGNRGGCVERLADATRRQDVFATFPWVLYASDDPIRDIMTRRLVNAFERVIMAAGIPLLGSRFAFTRATPNATTGTLTDAARESIHGILFQAASNEFGTEFLNAADASLDTGLIQVNPSVVVSGQNILGLSVTGAPAGYGYAKDLTITVAVKGGN